MGIFEKTWCTYVYFGKLMLNYISFSDLMVEISPKSSYLKFKYIYTIFANSTLHSESLPEAELLYLFITTRNGQCCSWLKTTDLFQMKHKTFASLRKREETVLKN